MFRREFNIVIIFLLSLTAFDAMAMNSRKRGYPAEEPSSQITIVATLTCESCRERGVGCDGIFPCGKCRQDNVHCVFKNPAAGKAKKLRAIHPRPLTRSDLPSLSTDAMPQKTREDFERLVKKLSDQCIELARERNQMCEKLRQEQLHFAQFIDLAQNEIAQLRDSQRQLIHMQAELTNDMRNYMASLKTPTAQTTSTSTNSTTTTTAPQSGMTGFEFGYTSFCNEEEEEENESNNNNNNNAGETQDGNVDGFNIYDFLAEEFKKND